MHGLKHRSCGERLKEEEGLFRLWLSFSFRWELWGMLNVKFDANKSKAKEKKECEKT